MKFLNTKYLMLFVFSIVLFGSCEDTEMVSPNIEKTKRTADIKSAPIVVSNTAFGSLSAPFTIPNFTIEDEIIMLVVDYNGEAEAADFYLTTDGNIEDVDGLDVMNIRLVRNISNTVSKSDMQQQLNYDLSPINSLISGSVYLNIEGLGLINYSK